MNLQQAAELIARYGNVKADASELLKKSPGLPTAGQLAAAREQCYRAVDEAFRLVEEHHTDPVQKILDVLERQTFCDWYEKEFADYMQDIDENLSRAEHKEKVLAKIRELFGVT